ncbi:hypothetical protein SAMN06298216_3046 [Spirosomataceae bacterium TFI 002]|nr:hypothetical protein SAMN06298216_3046 [Spirosomataceae bacterium TFI 002]
MEKLLLIVFAHCTFVSFSQITATGTGSSWMNGTYVPYNPVIPGNPTCSFPVASDAGTVILKKNNSAQGFPWNYQFRRINGYWYIEAVYNTNAGTSVEFRTKFQEFTNTPPCGVTWIKFNNNYCYDGQSPLLSIGETNNLIITGNCESCQVASDENHPLIHNFPVGDNASAANISLNNGLRKGSSYYHCGLRELVVYDGNYWNDKNGNLLFDSQFEILNLGNNIQFLIDNPYSSFVDHYEIEVSDNRSSWTSVGIFSNTTTSVNVLSAHYPEKVYHFRLKTIYPDHKPQYSCIQRFNKDYSGPTATTLPPPDDCCSAAISIEEDYIPGTLITMKIDRFVPDNTNYWYYKIKDAIGNTIVDQNFTPSASPHVVQISSGLFEHNKKYTAEVYNQNWGGSLLNSFYVKQPLVECSY